MSNAFVNAFAALKPSNGNDGFLLNSKPKPRLPTPVARTNRIFGSSLPTQSNFADENTSSEISEFVVGKFLQMKKIA